MSTPLCPIHKTPMVYADGAAPYHDVRRPHYRCEVWVGSGVCGKTVRPELIERSNDVSDSIDLLTHKPDGTPRHPSIAGVLKHFRYAHLPEHLQGVSKPCAELAIQMANTLPENPDLTCGLRDLLTAKDNFVRSRL